MFSNTNANSNQKFTLGYPFVISFLEKWAALNWDKSYLDKVRSNDTGVQQSAIMMARNKQ